MYYVISSNLLLAVNKKEFQTHENMQFYLLPTVFHKNNPVLNCPQLWQMLTDFQKFFTLGLSSDCVMN